MTRKVYFVRGGDMVKVGCSIDPETRLTQLGEWVPFKLELVATVEGGFDLEADLHALFADSWSHLEWFNITPKIEAVIADVLAGRELTIPQLPRDTGKEAFKTAKKRASIRVTVAERRAYPELSYRDRVARRPAYVSEALESYAGPHNAPPTPPCLAAISRYERELAA